MTPYEERAREQMARAVTRVLDVHPLAQSLLTKPVTVEHSSGCVWVVVEMAGQGVLARVHDVAWWEPRLRTVEDQAEELAGRLVSDLWGRRPKPGRACPQ